MTDAHSVSYATTVLLVNETCMCLVGVHFACPRPPSPSSVPDRKKPTRPRWIVIWLLPKIHADASTAAVHFVAAVNLNLHPEAPTGLPKL